MAIPFTTSVLTRDFRQTDGGIPVEITITNNDTTNAVTYRLNPRSEQTFNAPPNGDTKIKNLLTDAFIELTPDPADGEGILSADLAMPEELVALGWVSKSDVGL